MPSRWLRQPEPLRASLPPRDRALTQRLPSPALNPARLKFPGKTPTSPARKFHPVSPRHYANHDWALPIGHVFYDERDNLLRVKFWVRGSETRLEPHLFYRGREVSMVWAGQRRSSGCRSTDIQLRPSGSVSGTLPQGAAWNRIDCYLNGSYVKQFADNPGAHAISASPGEYEVKVLRNDRLGTRALGRQAPSTATRSRASTGHCGWRVP